MSTLWQPFTQMLNADPIVIERAEGVWLYTPDGRRYLDAISSWWVNLHGHSHPVIAEAIAAQARKLEHVIFAGFVHQPGIELAQKLTELLPGHLARIFYSDNGSTAVEVALKMAIQYWHNQGANKKKIINLQGGYHGDTMGAMSTAGKTVFSKPFWDYLFLTQSIPPPFPGQEELSILAFEALAKKGDVACFIFEPLLQCAGGMRIYSKEGLDVLLGICKRYDILTIADEVATGFGRTGQLFACDSLKNSVDLMCLSKGITGGFLPLGATACSERIYRAFLSDDVSKSFLHGHSYAGNPIACSAALASLDLTIASTGKRSQIAVQQAAFCCKWQGHPKLKRCQSIGTILILEFNTETVSGYFNTLGKTLYTEALSNHLLLRPLGNTIYVLPPYCITSDQLNLIYTFLIDLLEKKL